MIRGNLQDRPWGKTLGTLARRGVSGQLTLRNHNARFQIAFDHGLVIAATSAGSAESAIALAFRQGLITPAQVADIQHRSFGGANDWGLLGEVLDASQIVRLQRQAIAACVARTFVFEQGELTLDSQITLRALPNTAAHVGGMIFHGARMYLGEQRLGEAVRALGSRFTYRQPEDLRHFGFGPREQPIVDAVLQGTSASLLDTLGHEDERRTARAVVYALATCGVLHCEGTQIAPTGHPVVRQSERRFARGTSEPARKAEGTPAPRRTPGFRTAAIESAALAFARGDEALRVGNVDEALAALERASELAPERLDYQCTLAWARFEAAADKLVVADAIRTVLIHAIRHAERPALPHYYLGLVERSLGRDDKARAHFQQALVLEPDHGGALREVT